MRVSVGVSEISISRDIITSGEYNIHDVEFKFSKEYENLVKIAVFSSKDKVYKVQIINNKTIIPWEVLTESGDITLGVYGFGEVNNELILRYSPVPVVITVEKGSYIDHSDNSEPLTPTDVEQIEMQLNNIDVKTWKVGNKTYIRMTNPDGQTTESVLIDGKDYVITDSDYQAIADIVLSDITIPTKLSQLENDADYVKNTDYASNDTGGVVKTSTGYALNMDTTNGRLRASILTYEQLLSSARSNNAFVSKKTLLNALDYFTTFDTTERAIGSYFGDTIYRKCLKLTASEYSALSTTSSRKVLPLNTNIKSILKADLSTNYNDGTKVVSKNYPMHMVNTGNSYDQGAHIYEDGSLQIYVGSTILNGLIGDINIVLEYTKNA